jgi:hypothetical protein
MKRYLPAVAALLLSPSWAMSQPPDDWLYFARSQAKEVWPIYKELSRDLPQLEAKSSGFLSHAIVDLDEDGTNELLLRYSEISACVRLACPILVARHDGQAWGLSGLFYTYRVGLGDTDQSGFRVLWTTASVSDDAEPIPYTMAGDTYRLDIGHYGTSVEWVDADGRLEDLISADNPEISLFMRSSRAPGDRVLMADPDVNGDDVADLLVRIEHASVCNRGGCPTLVYVNGSLTYQGYTDPDTDIVVIGGETELYPLLAHAEGQPVSWTWNVDLNTYEERGL